MQFGRTKRLADFSDIPTGRELANDADALALLDFAELPFFMSLPFAAPPGVPADRAAALQHGFMADVQGQGITRRRRTSSASR